MGDPETDQAGYAKTSSYKLRRFIRAGVKDTHEAE
jgi:hypothetical protein